MIRKLFTVWIMIAGIIGGGELNAQDPQFSQYYAAPLYLNPALTGVNQIGRAGVNYRNQWPSLAANFETYSFYLDYNFEDYNSSAGLIVTTDREGLAGLRSTSIGALYAYEVGLNYRWTFRPGLQIGYTIRDINFDRLTFGDQFDNTGLVRPVTAEPFNTGLSARFFDVAAGGLIFNEKIWFGGSIHHINEPNQSILDGNSPLRHKVSFHGGYRILFEQINPLYQAPDGMERSVTPTFNYRYQGDYDQLDVGAYVTVEPILVGLWYRGVPVKTFNGFPINESVVMMFGLNIGKTTMGYSFDYTISDLGINSGGAHEISLIYKFNLNDPRKPPKEVRQLKCPVPYIF